MPKKIFTESEIKQIASKYIHSVHRDPETIPDIRTVITEAIKNVAPERELDEADVSSVISLLTKKATVTDKIIQEAAKKVIDQSALEDLKFLIRRNITHLGKRPTDTDVEAIIKRGKLDPYKSSIATIRSAVSDYFSQGKTAPTAPKMGPPTTPISRGREKRETKHDVVAGNFVPPKDGHKMTFFEKVRLKMFQYGRRALTQNARKWLKDNIYNVSKTPSRKRMINEGQTAAEAFIGKMFIYFYDAKTKKQLPYWDKFPLIFVLELYHDGWLGINLHYLPITLRIKLFDKLMQYADDKSLDKIQRLRLSYSLLKNFARFPEVKPCLKRYLSGYVRSELLSVDAIDWEIALFLPVEQFQKEKKEYVWRESKKMIRKVKGR